METTCQPTTIKDAIAYIVEYRLPVTCFSREAALARIIKALNEFFPPETAERSGVAMRWGKCSMCPNDAISLYTRKASFQGNWKEYVVVCVDWDYSKQGQFCIKDLYQRLRENLGIHSGDESKHPVLPLFCVV